MYMYYKHPLSAVKECDRLSLVSYDTQVYLDFGLTAMNKANKDKTKSLIGKLRDGSRTNLCGGLMKGTQIEIPVLKFWLVCKYL